MILITTSIGWLGLSFKNDNKKQFWHGYDKNETNKLHCYYMTNKDTGSEFLVRNIIYI